MQTRPRRGVGEKRRELWAQIQTLDTSERCDNLSVHVLAKILDGKLAAPYFLM